MDYIQDITLDIYETYHNPVVIDAKQYDHKSRYVRVQMTADGAAIQATQDMEIHFRALKPDGNSVDIPATAQEDGSILAELTEQTLACEGVTLADVVLMKDGEVLSPAAFLLNVSKSPVGKDIKSTNEFALLQDATQGAVEAAEKANAAAVEADEATERVNNALESAMFVRGATFELTIPADGWGMGEAALSDERILDGETYNYFISPTPDSFTDYTSASVRPASISEGKITFACRVQPETDIVINVFRVEAVNV